MKEYTHRILDIPQEMLRVMSYQMDDETVRNHVTKIIEDALNEMAKDRWEPLTPFGPPMIWFVREKKTKRKKT